MWEEPSKDRGLEDYQSFAKAMHEADPSLCELITRNITRQGWKRMVRDFRENEPQYYRRLRRTVTALKNKERRVVTPGGDEDTVEASRKLANDLVRGYKCGKGFGDYPQTIPVTIKLAHDAPVTGLPKGILAIADGVAKDFEGHRAWTFGFDNRLFNTRISPEAIPYLTGHPSVEGIEYELQPSVRVMVTPIPAYNPAGENLDWGVERTLCAVPWGENNYGENVKVAILDTGFARSHVDFWDSGETPYVDGYNFVASNDNPEDDHDHGTYCAGIVCAQHNGLGYKGIAPGIDLYVGKVLNAKGSGYFSDIAAAIDWARTIGVHIISMSLGASSGATILETACNNAWYAGVLLVAASGNDASELYVSYPAKYGSVVAVGAINYGEDVASFSNQGPELELCAPGVYISSAWAGHTYDEYQIGTYDYMCASGTSAATPHVAGCAALAKKWYMAFTATTLRQWLRDHARDL